MANGSQLFPELFHLPGVYEPFSALSHLLGAVLFAVLGLLLLRRGRGDRYRMILLSIYVGSCVLLMLTSTGYHMAIRDEPAAHRVLGRLDHSAIFILIAGTATPLHGLLFRGWGRWGGLAFIWAAAVAGVTLKLVYYDALAQTEWILLSFYLAMGWVGGISAIILARRYGWAFAQPLLLGGVAYTVGALMQFLGWPVVIPRVMHPHDVFHLAVLAGAFCHWQFTWQFAAGDVPQPRIAGASTSRSVSSAVRNGRP